MTIVLLTSDPRDYGSLIGHMMVRDAGRGLRSGQTFVRVPEIALDGVELLSRLSILHAAGHLHGVMASLLLDVGT